MNYTHVIFDLDGTLLPEDKAIDKNGLKTLGEKLLEVGCFVMFATGRSLDKVIKLEEVIEALSPEVIVTNGGAEIFTKINGQFVCDTEYFKYIEAHSGFFDRETVIRYLSEFDFLTLQESKYQFDYKISYYIELNKCDSINFFINDFKARFNEHELLISLTKNESGIHYLDVQSIYGTKYAALAYVLKNMCVEEGNVKYFGDNGNDIPCIIGFEQALMISTYKDSLIDMYPELIENNINWLEDAGPFSLLENLEGLE